MADPEKPFPEYSDTKMQVRNPKTKRMIATGGKQHKELIKEGVLPPMDNVRAPIRATTNGTRQIVKETAPVDPKRHIRNAKPPPLVQRIDAPLLHLASSDEEAELGSPSSKAMPAEREYTEEELGHPDSSDDEWRTIVEAAMEDPEFAEYEYDELSALLKRIL